MGDTKLPEDLLINLDGIKHLAIMYSDLGAVHFDKKDYEKALKYFEEALEYFDILLVNFDEQLAASDTFYNDMQNYVIEVKKNLIHTANILGDKKAEDKEFTQALDYYKHILCFNLKDSYIYFKMGNCLRESGAYIAAISFLEKALRLNPKNNDIYRVIGDIYNFNIKDCQNAINYYTKYVELEPPNQVFHIIYNMLGHLYETVDKYGSIDKQIDFFEKAVKTLPSFKAAVKNLALIYPRAGRDLEAIKCYHDLFKLGATMDDYFDYAALKIKLGDFKEGWEYYEYRFSKENGATVYPKIKQPKWKGQKIPNKTLLVQYEQGFGDSIMFLRYLEQVKPLAKKIIFRVQNELVDLFKINIEGFEVVGMSTPLEKLSFDYHVPLISLMHLLNTTIDNILASKGYIKADESKVAKYKEAFFDNDCIKIGIVWHGSIGGNELRNIPIESFFPLMKLKNVKIYSFQKDISAEDLDKLPKDSTLINLGQTFNDFSDTAAAMENLDLFITGDNAVFNLAGAMGKKTFVLLNKDSEWRWFLDEETTPWYDSVRIFKKQSESESWDSIMQRVMKNLE